MIMTMGVQECDSFDQEDIDYIQAELLNLEGPLLSNLKTLLQDQAPLVSFGSIDIVKSLLQQQNKDIKFIGCDKDAQFRSFIYVLLLIGVQQHKNYPHLNTLIRQQFFKPNIFSNHTSQINPSVQQQTMLQKCLNYFQQLDQEVQTQEYMLNQSLFQSACITMLKNSIDQQQTASIQVQLANKFHIDLQDSQCFKLGANNNFYIIKEQNYYFLLALDFNKNLNLKKLEFESMGSEDSNPEAEVQPSNNSTPQFKNSEVRFRKKSHKNSFGGDLQVVQYRDLLYMQSQRLNRMSISKNKVLSDYLDANQVQSCAEHIQQKQMNSNIISKGFGQNIIGNQKASIKGSAIQQSIQLINNLERRQNRRISFSQIIQYHDIHQIIHNEEQNQQTTKQDTKYSSQPFTNLPNSKVAEESQFTRMRTSLINNQQLQRIEQRHSSQRDSTHPDQQNSEKSQNMQIYGDQQSLTKMKDRRYSCLTQKKTSNKTVSLKQLQPKNYMFNFPQNQHQNSEIITQSSHQQDKIKSYSVQNNNLFSEFNSHNQKLYTVKQKNKYQNINLQLKSCVYSYEITNQPKGWIRKEIIYYFPNNSRQTIVVNNPYPHAQKSQLQNNRTATIPSLIFGANIHNKQAQNSSYRNPFQEFSSHSSETLRKYHSKYNKNRPMSNYHQETQNISTNSNQTSTIIKPKIVFNYLPPVNNLQSIQSQIISPRMILLQQPFQYPSSFISNKYIPIPVHLVPNLASQINKRPQTYGGPIKSNWDNQFYTLR